MLKKCVICGKEFNSKKGVITCSHECYLVRKRELDARGNFVRYSGQKKNKKCLVCKKSFMLKKNILYIVLWNVEKKQPERKRKSILKNIMKITKMK